MSVINPKDPDFSSNPTARSVEPKQKSSVVQAPLQALPEKPLESNQDMILKYKPNLQSKISNLINTVSGGVFGKSDVQREKEIKSFTDSYVKHRAAAETVNFWSAELENTSSPFKSVYEKTLKDALKELSKASDEMHSNPTNEKLLKKLGTTKLEELPKKQIETTLAKNLAAKNQLMDKSLDGEMKVIYLRLAQDEVDYLQSIPLDSSNSSKEFQQNVKERLVKATRELVECEQAVKDDPLLKQYMGLGGTKAALFEHTQEQFVGFKSANEETRKQEIASEKSKYAETLKNGAVYKQAVAQYEKAVKARPDMADKLTLEQFLPEDMVKALSPEDLKQIAKIKEKQSDLTDKLKNTLVEDQPLSNLLKPITSDWQKYKPEETPKGFQTSLEKASDNLEIDLKRIADSTDAQALKSELEEKEAALMDALLNPVPTYQLQNLNAVIKALKDKLSHL